MASKRERKFAYWQKLWDLCDNYEKVILVNADNVGSKQIQDVRRQLRGKATILFGKNTLIRSGLKHRMAKPRPDDFDYEDRKDTWTEADHLQVLYDQCKLNVAMCFCHTDMSEIADIIESVKVGADAKAGSIAPVDVVVPAGPTGMDPGQTSFFQALGIGTKIVKGQIEIVSDQHLVHVDKKVGNSEAVLLKKLNIKPFSYALKLINIYDGGNIYSPKVLKLSQDEILEKFLQGVRNIAALSLSMGIPTQASVPHSIANGFKNLVALALAGDYTFDQADLLIKMIKDPSAYASAAPVAAAKVEETAAAPVEEEEEEEDDFGFDLFG